MGLDLACVGRLRLRMSYCPIFVSALLRLWKVSLYMFTAYDSNTAEEHDSQN